MKSCNELTEKNEVKTEVRKTFCTLISSRNFYLKIERNIKPFLGKKKFLENFEFKIFYQFFRTILHRNETIMLVIKNKIGTENSVVSIDFSSRKNVLIYFGKQFTRDEIQ